MVRVIRPINSWLALLERIKVPGGSDDAGWVAVMRSKLSEGWGPSDWECDRMEKLRDQYGERE